MSARVNQLETTVLELGTELFKLRREMTEMRSFHDQFVKTMRGLKQVLDEKGVVNSDDFEAAVDFVDLLRNANPVDIGIERELENLKKSTH